MAARKAPQLEGPRSPIRVASSETDWNRLMGGALRLAEKMKDPRLVGLRDAMASGQTESYLRRLGIVCPADLIREFPEKT